MAFNRGDVVEMLVQIPSSVMGGHGHVLAFALHGPAIAVELRVARHARDVHHALDLVPARPGDQLERRHALQQR